MSNPHIMLLMQQMLFYAISGICLITLPTLVVGLVFSVIQAATQINEMTLTFVPKLIVMFTLLFFMGPWFMNKLVLMMRLLMYNLQDYIR